MKTAPITRERLATSDNFRVQVHPPDPLLFGAIYNYLCKALPNQAAALRDNEGKSIQGAFIVLMSMICECREQCRDFTKWIENPENVEPELVNLLKTKLDAANIKLYGETS